MEDNDFLEELRQIVMRRATAMHLVDTMAFVSEVAERLDEDPVFGEFTLLDPEYSGVSNRKTLKLHGYTEFDEVDGSIGLVLGKWVDSSATEKLFTIEFRQLFSYLENFVQESIFSDLEEKIVESNPAYGLATTLSSSRGKINRIRLHLFTNQSLSNSVKEELCEPIAGIQIERHIWDLNRIKAMYESSREREAVEINLNDFGSKGIPCIEAAKTDNLRSFLCVIDGGLLADMFERFGSRLLEGNVRSFLGMKGGVNKGIRSTIQDSPSLFFAYNNGIAATAAEVRLETVDGKPHITELTDLQIVNGGQTTASILNARKKEHLSLENVTVQLKLTEVERRDAHELIPRIAQYANTQNKIAVADFFANHPFHVKMEEISRRLTVPSKAGVRVQSKWFYERSRGQFQNERLYLAATKKSAFDLEFPPEQLINKTDLAKYDSTWKERPHWVSLGAQKNFTKFADQFSSKDTELSESEYWTHISPHFGEHYYQEIVAIAIMWRQTETLVSSARGDWYEGGYRPQIVAFSLALLCHMLRAEHKELNLMQIWQSQGISHELEQCIKDIAIQTQKAILSPPSGMTNVGEWTKKEACWDSIKKLSPIDTARLDAWVVSKIEYREKKSAGKRQAQQDDGISLQMQIIDLTQKGYWKSLLTWSNLSSHTTPNEQGLITKASTSQGVLRVSLEKDWRKLMEIKERCESEGFRKV